MALFGRRRPGESRLRATSGRSIIAHSAKSSPVGDMGSRLSATTKRRLAGPKFAFDVERLELAGHVFSLAKCILRTHGESYGLRGDEG